MSIQFACEGCGSPSVVVPLVLSDDAPMSCKGCGCRLGTWADFKARTRRVILAEADLSAGSIERLSADPLPLSWTGLP